MTISASAPQPADPSAAESWLDNPKPQVIAQNALGKAVNYLASNWSRLQRYVEGGHLPI